MRFATITASEERNRNLAPVLCPPDGGAQGLRQCREVKMMLVRMGAPLAACLAILSVAPAQAQQANMSFFVTSVGPGKGADLGGLAGADQQCQRDEKDAQIVHKAVIAYEHGGGNGETELLL